VTVKYHDQCRKTRGEELPPHVEHHAILLAAETIAQAKEGGEGSAASYEEALARVSRYLADLALSRQIPPMDTARLHKCANDLAGKGEQEAARRAAMAQALEIAVGLQAAMAGLSGGSDWIFAMGKQKTCAMLSFS
jgi:hypothetical protein